MRSRRSASDAIGSCTTAFQGGRVHWLPCRRPWKAVVLGSLGLALVWTAGCGNPHGVVKVTGTVTVDGQNPPGPGKIMFTPQQAADGFPTRSAAAQFGGDGRYSVRSFPKHEGIIPGHYQVAVECWETPPNLEGKRVQSYIAEKHQSPTTSGLALNVDPNAKPIRFDISLTSR